MDTELKFEQILFFDVLAKAITTHEETTETSMLKEPIDNDVDTTAKAMIWLHNHNAKSFATKTNHLEDLP